jgi:hypothetical protein
MTSSALLPWLLAAFLLVVTADSFVVPVPQPSKQQHGLFVATTTEQQLIPPKSVTDLMKQTDGTAAMYDEHVQKTYGYVVCACRVCVCDCIYIMCIADL